MKPRLIVFASGSATGGGSGFEKLCIAAQDGTLQAKIVAVVSNHQNGGVRKIAEKYSIPFEHFNGPYIASEYWRINIQYKAEWTALSGWIKIVKGLNPRTTINIHPGPLPEFGGKGFYGHHVHEAVLAAYKRGEVTHSAVTMHFVTPVYDEGPHILRIPVPIMPDDTTDTLGKRVNEVEHMWQAKITNLVVNKSIFLDKGIVVGAILH
ncbi:MAG TPA: formyltransferase family protein [Candidatus Paceibacterota bacterium]|jgi:phosphoribosylglycinamide formyltransferase-1|nr:formyltransferase family protein [Candidatus Paceibacterota bacterium]